MTLRSLCLFATLIVSALSLGCGHCDENASQQSNSADAHYRYGYSNQGSVTYYPANANRRFPYWYIWMDQAQRQDRIKDRAEAELLRAKADLKKAEAGEKRAKVQAAAIRVQEWQKQLTAVQKKISVHQKKIRLYELHAQSLNKISRGKTGGDVLNAFQFFLSEMNDTSGFLKSSTSESIDAKSFTSTEKVYIHDDGRVEVLKGEAKTVPATVNNLFGLLDFLRKEKVEIVQGSSAHKQLLMARDQLAGKCVELINQESAEVEKEMKEWQKIRSSFKDPFAGKE